ncbi:MAG: hypothetical protein IJF07_07605 [Lachnospiraceae bacterium]|nr:hypothetical protein [Lachnospiraceae bacterium]
MKNRYSAIALGLFAVLTLSACGSDPALAKFKNEMDDFCTAISEIDTSINNIDATSENATTALLGYLDDLENEFEEFSNLDFPEDFDYLEPLADESFDYMTEAVSSYHAAYTGDSYNEALAEYAKQNYARAYKRIQIIISFLHGEEPEDVDLTTSTSEGPIIE